jgi:hypothetical protein
MIGESRMWDSEICSWAPQDSDPRMVARLGPEVALLGSREGKQPLSRAKNGCSCAYLHLPEGMTVSCMFNGAARGAQDKLCDRCCEPAEPLQVTHSTTGWTTRDIIIDTSSRCLLQTGPQQKQGRAPSGGVSWQGTGFKTGRFVMHGLVL